MAPPTSGCLVLMCGHPASGKSTAAADLSRRIEAKGGRVVLIDEPGLHLHRNASYADARAEKNTRGLLKSTAERALYRDGPVVILDAGNAIKGFRYELWCVARQAATRFCVVHCDTPRTRRDEETSRVDHRVTSPRSGADTTAPSSTTLCTASRRRTGRTDGTRALRPSPAPRAPARGGAGNGAAEGADANATANVAATTSYVDTTREETLGVAVRMMRRPRKRSNGTAAASGRDRAR